MMDLERSTFDERTVLNHVKGFDKVCRLVWEEKLLLPQHTRLPSPTPSFLLIEEVSKRRKEEYLSVKAPHAFHINRYGSVSFECWCQGV